MPASTRYYAKDQLPYTVSPLNNTVKDYQRGKIVVLCKVSLLKKLDVDVYVNRCTAFDFV